jgi:hypothetical protein
MRTGYDSLVKSDNDDILLRIQYVRAVKNLLLRVFPPQALVESLITIKKALQLSIVISVRLIKILQMR